MKLHMRRIIESHTLSYEEMSTILCQIEACLNSRPLTYISSDPDDIQPITPGHFLIGSPINAAPQKVLIDTDTIVNRWQILQKMVHSFWHRWSSEYLNRLQQRTKWRSQRINLKINQVVMIRDEQLPPTKWLLGKVIKVHPGADGIVRVASVKCKNTTLKRPASKLCLLPIPDNEDEDAVVLLTALEHSRHNKLDNKREVPNYFNIYSDA